MALAYWIHASPVWVFASGGIAIVPLADQIRRATDSIAKQAGPAIGGLMAVSFGSITELILALFVLATGDTGIVKAQITGSLIGSSLLMLGIAILAGGWSRPKQSFKRERAQLISGLLTLSSIALLLPAFFHYSEVSQSARSILPALDEKLSVGVAIVLILVYLASLVYILITHREVFGARDSNEEAFWPLWVSIAVLLAATVLIAVESDLIANNVQRTAVHLGVTPFFLGIIVLALIGNAAELVSAIYFARRDRMDLVMGICIGSTVQVALLLAPALTLVSYFMSNHMNLVFTNPLELVAIVGAVFGVIAIAADGETTWFEGMLLVAVYCLFGLAFFFAKP
jgi:Ca2+:H+ antiporter